AAEEFGGIAVDGGGDVVLAHDLFARSSAVAAARLASTPATLMRKSMVPRLSSIGLQAALVALPSASSAAASTRVPIRAAPAASTRNGVGATAPSPTRACVQVPASSSTS